MQKHSIRIRQFLLFCFLSVFLIPVPVLSRAEHSSCGHRVEIAFDFLRQSTIASNQIALWIEDEQGQAVKTLLATSFTAGRRGYRNREMSLDHWTDAVQPETMTQEELDVISSATPSSGHLEYVWDLTDRKGLPIPDGRYRICLEGTLYWESSIVYSAVIDTATDQAGALSVESVRSQPDVRDNEGMLQNVTMTMIN